MNFSFAYLLSVFPKLFNYVSITLSIALLSMAFGVLLGLVLEACLRSKFKPLALGAACYVSFFRASPLLVQLYILYFGLPQLFPVFSAVNAYQATVIGISLNSAAYLAEIFRASIQSVDEGQVEASLSIGLTKWQTMRRIVLPQAARVAIPGMGNTFVTVLKETSLGFTLGLTEMLAQAKLMAGDSFHYMECFLAAALLYWLAALAFGWFQRRYERTLGRPYRQQSYS